MVSGRTWGKEELANAFHEYYKEEKDIGSKKLSKKYPGIYKSILRNFGSYEDFIRMLGYEHSKKGRARKWTDEKIKHEFTNYKDKGNPIQYSKLHEMNPNLAMAIHTYYNSYADFLEEMGIDPTTVYKNERKWSEEVVKSEFKKRIDNKQNISPSCLLTEDSSLIGNMVKYYGSYKNAVEVFGLNYKDCISDTNKTKRSGHLFEGLVRIMFEKLERQYIYHYTGFSGYTVDFYNPEANEIFDAKLSSWSAFTSNTIQNYLPLSNSLTIIFLRGNKVKHNYGNLTLTSIDEFYPILKDKKLDWLIQDFEKLKDDVKYEELLEQQEEKKRLTLDELKDIKEFLEKSVNDVGYVSALNVLYNEMLYLKKDIVALKKNIKNNT